MLTIDGSFGEGGGQILRTCLSLSLVTGTPFRIGKIRAGRKRPGLLQQHLTGVRAAAKVGCADVEGAALGSAALVFRPQGVQPGDYAFRVGTAGSAVLVLQTILPPLLVASGPSTITVEGGTHNPWAPPFDFLARAYLPLVQKMGPRVDAVLERPGFYPAGGGKLQVTIEPAKHLKPLELLERGRIVRCHARALVARLPESIAQRELRLVERLLEWKNDCLESVVIEESSGPGNVLLLEVRSEALTEVFTGFGMRGVPAEKVARRVVGEVKHYLKSGAPVGPHLADQWVLLVAMAGGGRFRTVEPTQHTTTNSMVLERFLPVRVRKTYLEEGVWEISIEPKD